MGTLIVAALLLLAVAFAVIKIVKDKKAGKCSCGGGCSGCLMSGSCHKALEGSGKEKSGRPEK